jgi:nucleotidyltransferase substrate binding protein (TIGR01987 family)
MSLDTFYLKKCISTLSLAFQLYNESNDEGYSKELYRSAVIKEFEIILEQSGKLLKKVLKPYFHTDKISSKLYFKDVFRMAHQFNILKEDEVERWLVYRDNRNLTSHDYGVGFAESTLLLIPAFIEDSTKLAQIIEEATI